MSLTASLAAGAAATLFLVALHLLAPRLRAIPGVEERAAASFAGGTAVSYVFLHLLPELAAGNERLAEALGTRAGAPTPLAEVLVFVVALAGFLFLYGAERLAHRHGEGHGGSGRTDVFAVHLAAFALYNAVITYTMPLRFRTGVAFAALFAVAMGAHFVLTDRSLREHYPQRFARVGRPVLAGALVLGWLAALVAAPTSPTVVSVLIALLAGFILMNVFKDELPGEDRSHFGWFSAGVAVFAALLVGMHAAA